jgi:hypothetical protein
MKSGEMERMPEGAHNSMTGDIAHGADAKERALIFLHIAKTAGSTLHAIIERQFAPEVTHNLKRIRPPRSIQEFFNLPESERRRIRLLKGHMPYGLHKYLSVPATYLTMLRDPVDRVISQYYFTLRMPGISLYEEITSKHMSLADFALKRASLGVVNDQTILLSGVEKVNTALLSGVEMPSFAGNEEVASEDTLRIAIQNLENHFAVVGLSERFDESVLLLKREFGWKNIFYVKRNVTKDRPTKQQVPREVIELIEKQNFLDVQLYEYARQRFEEAIKEQGRNFESELRSFQRKNKLYGTMWRGYMRAQRTIPIVKATVSRLHK